MPFLALARRDKREWDVNHHINQASLAAFAYEPLLAYACSVYRGRSRARLNCREANGRYVE
jgi:hypothetical protein